MIQAVEKGFVECQKDVVSLVLDVVLLRSELMERAFKQQENNNPDSRQRHILLLKRTHSTFKPSGIKERKGRG